MAIGMFDTRAMMAMMESLVPPRTFLRDTFFPEVETPDTQFVDIDIRRGKRRMAAFVHPNHPGQVVRRDGYRTETYRPPYVKPKRVTTAEDLLARTAGETIYGGKSPEERAREILAKDLMELDEMITRREEWMAAQALLTGQVRLVGDGVDDTVSFGLQSTHDITLGSGSRFGDSGVDIVEVLRGWQLIPVKDCGIAPTDIVMGTKVWNAIRKDKTLLESLDCKNLNIGSVDPGLRTDGTIYLGYLSEVGCRLWTYAEWYLDDLDPDGSGLPKEKPMIPENKLVMLSTGLRGVRLYGAVVDVTADGAALWTVPRAPKSWTEPDPSLRFLQMRSRPLLVPREIDSVLVAVPVA